MGLDFGMFKKKQLSEANKNIAFIDFGHSKFSVSLLKFSSSSMEVLTQKSYSNLGCRNIDMKLFTVISESFKEKTGLNIMDNKKAFLKVMEVIQRQRKIISGINQTEISIECLMEDEDLSETISRDKMVSVATDVFSKIEYVLREFKDEITKNDVTLDMIELVGGGTRIPAVIDLIKSIFEIQPSRTINSSETIARGAALYAVKKSGLFKYIDYSINNKIRTPIKAFWDAEEKEESALLFDGTQTLPAQKTLKVKYNNGIKIVAEKEKENINIMNITTEQLAQETEIQLNFQISEEGVLFLNRSKAKEGENIKIICKNQGVLEATEILKFKQVEREMFVRDFEIMRSYEKKNELETIIYQQKEKLASKEFSQYLKAELISQTIEDFSKLSEEVEEGNTNFNIKYYEEKINYITKQMKDLQSKTQSKKDEISQYFTELNKFKKFTEENLQAISSRYRNTQKVVRIYESIKGHLEWIVDLIDLSQTENAQELPLINPKELEEKYQQIQELLEELNRPQSRPFEEPSRRQQFFEEPSYYQQRTPKPQRRGEPIPRQQRNQYDQFNRNGFFGNGFFNNMGSFF